MKIFLFALINKLSPSHLGILNEQADTFILFFVFNKVFFFNLIWPSVIKVKQLDKLFMKKKLQ